MDSGEPYSHKIAIFGGTFDPPHLGHLMIAEWAMVELALNGVYFVPNSGHPFQKRMDILAGKIRLHLLELAIAGYPDFFADSFEIEKGGTSYAVETILHFKNRFPNSTLFYLMGEDNVETFHRWKDPNIITQNAQIVVFTRNGLLQNTDYPQYHFLNNPVVEISSSAIRERISQGKKCQTLTPPKVYAFISENNLYRR
jgi:nicotinate-nucleotide adenylyltransferase